MSSINVASIRLPESLHHTLDYTMQPMVLPKLSPLHEAHLEDAYKLAVDAITADGETDGWSLRSEKDDMRLYTKKPTDPRHTKEYVKGMGVLNMSPVLFSILCQFLDWRTLFDDQFGGGERVITLDPMTGITHSQFKTPWPVKQRDFLVIERTLLVPRSAPEVATVEVAEPEELLSPSRIDTASPTTTRSSSPVREPSPLPEKADEELHALFTFSTSVTSDKCPEKPHVVRGLVNFVGLYVEAIPGEPDKCKVIFSMGSDPLGHLPTALVNMSSIKQPQCINAIRKLIKSQPKILTQLQAKLKQLENQSRRNHKKNHKHA